MSDGLTEQQLHAMSLPNYKRRRTIPQLVQDRALLLDEVRRLRERVAELEDEIHSHSHAKKYAANLAKLGVLVSDVVIDDIDRTLWAQIETPHPQEAGQ